MRVGGQKPLPGTGNTGRSKRKPVVNSPALSSPSRTDIEINFDDDDSQSEDVLQKSKRTVRKLPSPKKAPAGVAKKRTSPRKAAQQSQRRGAKQGETNTAGPSNTNGSNCEQQEHESAQADACSTPRAMDCEVPALASTLEATGRQLASPEALTKLVLAERSAAGPASTSGPDPQPLVPAARQQAAALAQRLLRRRLLDLEGAGMALRPDLEAARAKLYKQLSTTVETPGANTSYLIIGARGTGKTLVVERTVAQLCTKYNTNPESPVVGVVRLTGLLHGAERVAFREIARQLCAGFNVTFSRAASLADNLDFLRDMLKELRKGHKSVVFVLDEFDLFAKPVKQTVLYNLLDALQATNIQAAVVGLSARFDVMEIMEKRVKSRFSHRRDVLLELDAAACDGPHGGVPSLLSAMLALPEESTSDDLPCAAFCREWNASLAVALQDADLLGQLRLLADKGLTTPADLNQVALAAVMRAGREAGPLQLLHLQAAVAAAQHRSQVDSIASLGILELFILVAALRLHRRGYERVNFELLWAEYAKTGGMHHSDVYSRPAAARAFQRLLDAALLVFVDARSERRAGLWEFSGVVARVEEAEVAQALHQHGQCPPLLKNWLAKDIVQVGSYADE